MDYILIDRFTATMLIISFVLLVIGLVMLAANWQSERNQNRRLRRTNGFLRNRLSTTQHALYKATYKLPEYEGEDGNV